MEEVMVLHLVYLRLVEIRIPNPPPRLWSLQLWTKSYPGMDIGGEVGVIQVSLNRTISGDLPSTHELSKSVSNVVLLYKLWHWAA